MRNVLKITNVDTTEDKKHVIVERNNVKSILKQTIGKLNNGKFYQQYLASLESPTPEIIQNDQSIILDKYKNIKQKIQKLSRLALITVIENILKLNDESIENQVNIVKCEFDILDNQNIYNLSLSPLRKFLFMVASSDNKDIINIIEKNIDNCDTYLVEI